MCVTLRPFFLFALVNKANRSSLQLINKGTTYDEADQSAKLILEMFPELNDSTDLFFLMPSKKAFRRFPASQPLPRPLDRSMRAHRILHDRISRATVEVADIALRKLPSLTIYLDKKLTSKRLVANVHPRLLEAVITTRGISNPFVARQVFIREVLLSGTRRQSSFVERGKNLKGIVEKNYGGGKLNGKNTYHGANFWEVEQSASSNARSVP